MKSHKSRSLLPLVGCRALVVASFCGCSGSNATATDNHEGGAPSAGTTANGGMSLTGGNTQGGANATGGIVSAGGTNSGGTPTTGGSVYAGGASNSAVGTAATGGVVSAGGSPATGGLPAITGGSRAVATTMNGTGTGGVAATGGVSGTGGTNNTGGTSTTGGTSNSTGGSKATGGLAATGGSRASGGAAPTGGAMATGGSRATTVVHPSDAVSFGGHWYRFTQASVSGEQAEAACEALHGYLVCIGSQAENDFVLSLAGSNRPWIGLNDVQSHGNYVWIDGSPVTYQNWLSGQPDLPDTELWVKLNADGHWDDASAVSAYICEWNS